ncbi:MAG: AMP-binding protein [Cyanobacteria bacterium Co-bin13]|nr:AMP-binding protein [Cyanobacteria bacterium Co-bin13]
MNAPSSSVLKSIHDRDLAFVSVQRRYETARSLPEVWPIAAQRFGGTMAMHDPHGTPTASLTYRELCDRIQTFASGLQALGVEPYAHVALFADNSHRWFIADQGIMTAGGVDAVRSATAEKEELLFIAENSDSTVLVVEDLKLFNRLRDRLDSLPIRLVVLLSDEVPPDDDRLKVVNFSQLLGLGENRPLSAVALKPEDLATLIYTSGTTGKPKGVMLTHANLLQQVNTLGGVVQPQAGDRVLGILPSWHVFERTVEYYLYSQGCTQTYTSIRHVKADLKSVKPQYMVGVPRLWESIYEGAQKQFREQPANKQKLINTFFGISNRYVTNLWRYQDLKLDEPNLTPLQRLGAGLVALANWPGHQLGKKLVYSKVREATGGQVKQLISGGGSLARHIDVFFEVINVPLLVGYGLTETAPVLSARRPWRNLRGAAGQPILDTEIKIVDLETGRDLPQGEKGLVLARGPQIMSGYYKNPDATAKAISPEGWFDTGDLGWITRDYNLVLTGRAKDTIVLTNGENIEPQPIEDACVRSAYIDQIMLVGQDQRSLGALIVPNLEALQQWAATQSLFIEVPGEETTAPAGFTLIGLEDEQLKKLFRAELNREVQDRPGYRPDDRIGPFSLISEPFTIDNGLLTQTLKVRRNVVTERYRGMIDAMFA